MKKLWFIMVVVWAAISPSICFAEENANIFNLEELTIQIMPEFAYHPNDQQKENPPVLIGYHGYMVNNSDQPQRGQIEIPLPMADEEVQIGYVADYSSDLKNVYELEYALDRKQGVITWTTSEEIQPQERYKFVIEFYSDALTVQQAKKSLKYQFTSFADIGLLNVVVTKPDKAKNMRLTPEANDRSHADGENTFSYLFQDVKAGDEKSFSLQYERSEEKPDLELMATEKITKEKKWNNLAVGAFSGVSLLSASAIVILIKKRKKN